MMTQKLNIICSKRMLLINGSLYFPYCRNSATKLRNLTQKETLSWVKDQLGSCFSDLGPISTSNSMKGNMKLLAGAQQSPSGTTSPSYTILYGTLRISGTSRDV